MWRKGVGGGRLATQVNYLISSKVPKPRFACFTLLYQANTCAEQGMEIPSTGQRSDGEMAQTGPVFSYAQAAKGRSPSLSVSASASQRSSKPYSETSSPANQRGGASEEPEKAALEGQKVSESGQVALETKLTSEQSVSAPQHVTDKGSKTKPDSIPSSPDLSSVSASTIPKEDDMFITTHGSSDSTWDRQSQTSQSGDKNGVKEDDAEKDGAKVGAWDQTPTVAPLKEAPPPSFNIWQQRAEKQAKAVKEPVVNQSGGHMSNKSNSQSVSNKKNQDIGSDLAKTDNSKKGKPSIQSGEETNSSPSVKEPGRSGDRKNRSGEERITAPYLFLKEPR